MFYQDDIFLYKTKMVFSQVILLLVLKRVSTIPVHGQIATLCRIDHAQRAHFLFNNFMTLAQNVSLYLNACLSNQTVIIIILFISGKETMDSSNVRCTVARKPEETCEE